MVVAESRGYPRDDSYSDKAEDMMPVRKPPQRSEDQLPNGHMSEPIKQIKQCVAESIMPQRNPPQRSEDQISTGHMLEPVKNSA